MSGVLAPGVALRQDSLARQYEVSHIPVREALLKLESQGLVESRRHRGVFVRPMSIAEADDLYRLRYEIEPNLVEESVATAKNGAFASGQTLLAEFDAELSERGATAYYCEKHWKFHRLLYSYSQRAHSIGILDRLYVISNRYFRLHSRLTSGASTRATAEHKELLVACISGKAKQAAAIVKTHTETIRFDLINALETDLIGTSDDK